MLRLTWTAPVMFSSTNGKGEGANLTQIEVQVVKINAKVGLYGLGDVLLDQWNTMRRD
jgi:hypothetical protein